MAGSSDDEGLKAGTKNKMSADFKKFAFAHRSNSDKSASKNAGTSNKPSLRAQLAEALSNGKNAKVRHSDTELVRRAQNVV